MYLFVLYDWSHDYLLLRIIDCREEPLVGLLKMGNNLGDYSGSGGANKPIGSKGDFSLVLQRGDLKLAIVLLSDALDLAV